MGFSVKKSFKKATKSISHAVSRGAKSFSGNFRINKHRFGRDILRSGINAAKLYYGAEYPTAYVGAEGTEQYIKVQQKRALKQAQEQARQAEKELLRAEQQQREYAYRQRVAQVDEMRERIGAGGGLNSNYRTKTNYKSMADSFGGNSGETLG